MNADAHTVTLPLADYQELVKNQKTPPDPDELRRQISVAFTKRIKAGGMSQMPLAVAQDLVQAMDAAIKEALS